MCIGDQDPRLAAEVAVSETGRATVFCLRRFPEPLQVSVAIEDLDSPGGVNDIEVIVGVDGQRTRFQESPVGFSATPPDEFGCDVGTVRLADASGQYGRCRDCRPRGLQESTTVGGDLCRHGWARVKVLARRVQL